MFYEDSDGSVIKHEDNSPLLHTRPQIRPEYLSLHILKCPGVIPSLMRSPFVSLSQVSEFVSYALDYIFSMRRIALKIKPTINKIDIPVHINSVYTYSVVSCSRFLFILSLIDTIFESNILSKICFHDSGK